MKKFIHLITVLLLTFQTNFGQSAQIKPYDSGPFGIQVNTFTGALYYERSDLFIPGKGLSMSITFHYNSGKVYFDRGYGHGWTFSYHMLYEKKGTSIVIERSNGQRDRYSFNGSGYDPPTGVYDELTEYQPDKFLLESKYGMKFYFEDASHHRITKIENRNGNTLTFDYTVGELTTITDPSGKQLILAWSGGHLSQVTDPNTTPSRVITYTYTGDNLTQVTDQDGNTISYGYGSWYNMTSLTDKNGVTLDITFTDKTVTNYNIPLLGIDKSFAYDTFEFTTTITDFVSSGNQVTIYHYNLDNKIDLIENACGDTMEYE